MMSNIKPFFIIYMRTLSSVEYKILTIWLHQSNTPNMSLNCFPFSAYTPAALNVPVFCTHLACSLNFLFTLACLFLFALF